MNNVVLIGRLTKDPDVRYSPSGDQKAICKFSVAVSRGDKENTADFINCVAFSKTAEFIGKYFTKGKQIALQGRISTGSYTNKDNVKVYTTEVAVDRVEFVGSKTDNAEQKPQNSDIPKGFYATDDEDCPF